jgi:hypothetical protein
VEIKYNQNNIKNTYIETFSKKNNFILLDPTLIKASLETNQDLKNISQKDNLIIVQRKNGKEERTINKEIADNLNDEERKKIVQAMITENSWKEVQDA